MIYYMHVVSNVNVFGLSHWMLISDSTCTLLIEQTLRIRQSNVSPTQCCSRCLHSEAAKVLIVINFIWVNKLNTVLTLPLTFWMKNFIYGTFSVHKKWTFYHLSQLKFLLFYIGHGTSQYNFVIRNYEYFVYFQNTSTIRRITWKI